MRSIWRGAASACGRWSSAWRSDPLGRGCACGWAGGWCLLPTQRLLLARSPVDGRVAVLRASLVREEHQLLGAVAVGVDVGDELQALALQLPKPQVGDLNRRLLVRRQNDPCLA